MAQPRQLRRAYRSLLRTARRTAPGPATQGGRRCPALRRMPGPGRVPIARTIRTRIRILGRRVRREAASARLHGRCPHRHPQPELPTLALIARVRADEHPVSRVTGVALPHFAVVDLETSGFSMRRHRILQIGLVTVDGDGTVIDEWSSLVKLRWPLQR